MQMHCINCSPMSEASMKAPSHVHQHDQVSTTRSGQASGSDGRGTSPSKYIALFTRMSALTPSWLRSGIARADLGRSDRHSRLASYHSENSRGMAAGTIMEHPITTNPCWELDPIRNTATALSYRVLARAAHCLADPIGCRDHSARPGNDHRQRILGASQKSCCRLQKQGTTMRTGRGNFPM